MNKTLEAFRNFQFPINPLLPENFDNCPNERRPAWQDELWDRLYIQIIDNDFWPDGKRYDVRCLDGGAWDRSTCIGQYGSLEEALKLCRNLTGGK